MSRYDPKSVSPRALRQRLASLKAAGIGQLPKPSQVVDSSITPPTKAASQDADTRAMDQTKQSDYIKTRQNQTVAPTLEVLKQEVCVCTACEELASQRTQTVFGVGNPNAQICFMGEAPGADEDRLGEPFVGRAGQLLTKIIEACGMQREDVYILNVLKCRPPGNRNPTPEESRNCRGFLTRQLELIDPEYICCLGAVAAQNFLETDTPIGRLRGKVHEHAGRRVICTYHPAYLLRNPSAKKATWDDMKLLMRQVGVEL